MSRRIRPPAASAGFLPLADRPGPEGAPALVHGAHGLRTARRVVRWRWGRLLLVAAALYSGWMGQREWLAYRSLHAASVSLDRQETALAAEHARLQQEIAYAQTSAYVAAAARQEFGLVSPDQIPLAPVSATGASSATGTGQPPAK